LTVRFDHGDKNISYSIDMKQRDKPLTTTEAHSDKK
jgi:hypothetical protein